MPLRIDDGVIFSGTDATGAIELIALSETPGTTKLFVDGNRTDTYVEDGTFDRPFKSVCSAITAVNLLVPGAANPCTIAVAPGIYNEAAFTIPQYVKVQGAGYQATVLKATDLNNHFITTSAASVLREVAIFGPTAANKAAVYHADNNAVAATVLDCIISRGYYGVLCNPTMSRGPMFLQNLVVEYAGDVIQEFVHSEGFADIYAIQCIAVAPDNKVVKGFVVSGANAVMTAVSCQYECGGTTDALFVDNSALCRLVACSFVHGLNAIHIGSNGAPKVFANSTIIQNDTGFGFTKDILIDTINAICTFTGSASTSKIDNTVGAELHANYINLDPTTIGTATLGDSLVGTDPTKMLPLSLYAKDAYLTGLRSGGTVTRNVSPSRVLNVALGYGYINDGANPIRVSWGNGTATIPANSTEYVYIDNTGAIQHNVVEPDYNATIILAQAITNATDVTLLTRDEITIDHMMTRLQEYFEDIVGPIVVSGCVTAMDAVPLKLDVSSGEYMIGLSERDVTGAAPITFTYWCHDGAGGWTATTGVTEIDDENYDNGTLAAFVNWKKDSLYVVVNNGGTEFHIVYGNSDFANQPAAVAGTLPAPPPVLLHYGMLSGGIVVNKSAGVINTVIDVRPRIGQQAAVAGVPGDHDLLVNLDHDTHPQYTTAARALIAHGTYPGAHVTGGDTHAHTAGAGAQINHTTLSNIGTRTHVQLESDINTHIGDTANPHVVTKTQVGLSAVTNDAQLKRSAGDYATFAAKASAINADILLIEDSADGGNKKKVTLANLPYPPAALHGGTHISTSSDPIPAVVAAGASGLMTGADKTKLDGIAAGATNNIFGTSYQTAVSLARSTWNTDTTFQTKVSLVTPALTGTYRVGWVATVDQSSNARETETRLYNVTDAVIVGALDIYRPPAGTTRKHVSGFAEVVFTGVAKTFSIQYRTSNTAGTAGIEDARIEIWRVS